MGISRLTISKILNHVETGVTAVYDRHSYDSEKREALDAWACRLIGIVSKPATVATGHADQPPVIISTRSVEHEEESKQAD
jgi:hypothetical protein